MGRFQKIEKTNHHFPELNRKKKIFQKISGLVSPRKITVLAVGLTFLVGLGYLFQINSTATQGYQIKELESRLEELKTKNEKLNLEYIEARSMAKMIDRAEQLNLVAVDKVEMITPVGSAVVRK